MPRHRKLLTAAMLAAMFTLPAFGAEAPTTTAAAADKIASLTAKADAGDAEAMCELAIEMQFGVKMKRDLDKAIKLLEKSADAGSFYAMDHLGDMYSRGDLGAPVDIEKAIAYYKKEIEKGGSWGCFSLGEIYRSGRGVPVDADAAEALFTKGVGLAQKGVAAGKAFDHEALGYAYHKGLGIKQDYFNALELYKIADRKGFPWTAPVIGSMYEVGEGVKKDEAEALKWYRKAADMGNTYGMMSMAAAYELGMGVEKDNKLVIEWYKKAADAGCCDAMTYLGMLYQRGDIVDQDDKASIEWTKKAVAKNYPAAMVGLGIRYRQGDGVPKDADKAHELFTKAAKLGDKMAQSLLNEETGGVIDP